MENDVTGLRRKTQARCAGEIVVLKAKPSDTHVLVAPAAYVVDSLQTTMIRGQRID